MMRPSTSYIVLKMIKAGIRNFRVIPHLFEVLFSFLHNYSGLRRWRSGGKKTLMIALIEHMGDIVAAEPVSRLARSTHPETPIAWASRKPYREVVENFSSVDRVVTVVCMTEWLLLWSTRTTDMVWDLHISERACLKCRVFFRKPGSPGKITYNTYFNYGNLLAVNCLSAQLSPIDVAPQIVPDTRAVRGVDNLGLPKRIIVIHCKSNEDRKDWPAEKWRVLVAWMTSQTNVTVCEIGLKAFTLRPDDPTTRDLCGSLSIMETAEVIRRAALFIGIDSGPAHLANATGTPGVILLGRYQGFETYNPYSGGYGDGSLADLVRSDGPAANIPVEAVMTHVSNRLQLGRLGGTNSTTHASGSVEKRLQH